MCYNIWADIDKECIIKNTFSTVKFSCLLLMNCLESFIWKLYLLVNYIISFRTDSLLGRSEYQSLKNDQSEIDEMQELIANEVEVQKKDIKDKKHQITALIAMLEKQRAIIQRVAEKMELSDRSVQQEIWLFF